MRLTLTQLSGKRYMRLKFNNANKLRMGDIYYQLYLRLPNLPADVPLELVGSRSGVKLSVFSRRFLARAARLRKATLWRGLNRKARRTIVLSRHCLPCTHS